jgi:hypothetical protein
MVAGLPPWFDSREPALSLAKGGRLHMSIVTPLYNLSVRSILIDSWSVIP